MINDVIIIGGGPAGLAAASQIKNKRVLLLEKNKRIGEKMRISGAGQCNLTHGGPIKEYQNHYGNKWRFVKEALMKFTNNDTIDLFSSYGLETIEREDLKVFPKSLKADDVVETFINMVKSDVDIHTDEVVEGITFNELWVVKTNKNTYRTQSVIIATGGHTYPNTGSTGDGFKFAKGLNVPVVEPRFALSPVYTKDHKLQSLQGLSFEACQITVFRQKKIGSYTGDLLITHFGFSGPVIINNSRDFRAGDVLNVNFTKYNTQQEVEKVLLDAIQKNPKKSVKHLLEMVPKRLANYLVSELKIEDVCGAELKKHDRKKLIQQMFAYTATLSHVGKMHIAMCTAGGIDTASINKKTYEVKSHSGLYFVGECVDVDGDTGGYNIQYAIASGRAAGRHVMEVL